MNYFRKAAAVALAAAMLAVTLAACGSAPAASQSAAPQSQSQSQSSQEEQSQDDGVLRIAEQGIFSAGGTVISSDGTFDVANYYTSREGSTSHVDHANVLYQIPEDATGLPMVFLHGYVPADGPQRLAG